ncbi:hypothetical protein [Streptomyces sp. NPDC055085]
MAALTTYDAVDAGTAGTGTAPTASDTVDIGNGHNIVAIYRNTSATPLVLTIVVPGNTSYGQAQPDPVITVPITTGEKWIPIRQAYDPGDGSNRATITATGITSGQTVQILRVS